MDLIDAIRQATDDPRVQISLLMGALMEGGSLTGPWAAGDSGTSFGPYQIHLPAHPDFTPASASDPAQAVNGWARDAYTQAAAQVPGDLWRADPKAAAAQTVYLAENPRDDQGIGAAVYGDRIDSAWNTIVTAAGGEPPSPDLAGGPGVFGTDFGRVITGAWMKDALDGLKHKFGPGSGAADIAGGVAERAYDATLGGLDKVASAVGVLVDPTTWHRIGLTLAAAVLIIVGVVVFTRPKAAPIPVPVPA